MPDNLPPFNPDVSALLEELTNAVGISGDEGEVRNIVTSRIKPLSDQYHTDTVGNILAIRRGKTKHPMKVMLAAHMDEVGGMILEEDEIGVYRFALVGGVDKRQLIGKSVLVGKHHLPGVIGIKPIHLTRPDEARRPIPVESLRIDLGPAVAGNVKPGDRISFSTRFQMNDEVILAKALDDRLGVAILIETFRKAPEHIDLMAAFTVQEEIGLRGARVASYRLDPEIALALDATNANEIPRWDDAENYLYNARLGRGPVIYVADNATLYDPRLIRYAAQTASRFNIPCQYRQPGPGGTDAGAIHRSRNGVPCLTISVPVRNIHAPVSIARVDDFHHTLRLVEQFLVNLTPALLSTEKA